jgi:hypothetical protein
MLDVDPRTVRKHWRELGGVRVGRSYRFFPDRLMGVPNAEPDYEKRSEDVAGGGAGEPAHEVVQDFPRRPAGAEGRAAVGGRGKKAPLSDRHGLLVNL